MDTCFEWTGLKEYAAVKKKQFKNIFNLLFLVAVFSLTIWSVFNGVDLKQLMTYLKSANLGYVLAGIPCVLMYILSESVIIYYLMRTLNTKVSFSHCCLFSFTGFFYSCITPGAGGGQPMQVLAMRKDRIPVAVSSVVLCIVTVTFKMVLVIFGLAVMIFRPAALMVYLDSVVLGIPVEIWIYVGLTLNIIWIIGLLMLIFNPALVRKLAYGIFKILTKLRLVRNPERMTARIERAVSQYQGTSDFFRTHKGVIVNVMIITFIQRCALFFITWLVYKAFALSGEGMPVVVSLQAMISVATDMLPLPGGMGASEKIFLSIFQPVFGQDLALPGMVLSRGISYYTQLLISGIMTVVASFVIKEKKEKGRE
jgi:uncharacterized protein (TIRG00374 family)